MKELTIEEKAKRYDEAFKEASAAYKDEDRHLKATLERIFPELKESGDERIELLNYLYDVHDDDDERARWITWLEKQGELKPTDKVKPKFHEGDWVVYKGDTCQIVSREEGCNKLVTNFGIEKELVNERNLSTARLWAIQDARDGDVLAYNDGSLTIFRYRLSSLDAGLYMSHIILTDKIEFKQTCAISNVHPATKEQRNFLFQKMKEAGYEWDAEKKELKKIEQKPAELPKCEDYGIDGLYNAIRILEETLGKVDGYQTDDGILEHKCAISAVKNLYEQKPAWSEEDEMMLNKLLAIVALYYGYCGNVLDKQSCTSFLKSLKDRVQPKSINDWSEEDERYTNIVVSALSSPYLERLYHFNSVKSNDIINWFESLKDRYTWKPSDEQMNILKQWLKDNQYKGDARYCYPIFESLYQELKKLKG